MSCLTKAKAAQTKMSPHFVYRNGGPSQCLKPSLLRDTNDVNIFIRRRRVGISLEDFPWQVLSGRSNICEKSRERSTKLLKLDAIITDCSIILMYSSFEKL